MLKLRTYRASIDLFCSLPVTDELLQVLNCATTGAPANHLPVDPATKARLLQRFETALLNAKPEDFNFRQLTDPDEWNQRPKGDIRTPNGAFFTLLYEYNLEAERAGKPIINGNDLIRFLKTCVRHQVEPPEIIHFNRDSRYPTGNDFIYVLQVKAPLSWLLQGKDEGILRENELFRSLKLGTETDVYVKVAFDPTYRRDENGNLTILEDGIQPLSIHRDADSKNTNPNPQKPSLKDVSWDTDRYHVSPKLMSKATKAWFKKYGPDYDPHKDEN